jgi:hypothetical protein
MKQICILLAAWAVSSISPALCAAQCVAPETIQGSEIYNKLVCQGVAALSSQKQEEALHDFLLASQKTTLEFPNTLLFGRIAKIYASLGRFKEANEYLEYDNISLLWSMGVVRCRADSSADQEVLFQDGVLLKSTAASHMASVLCGEIYDNNAYFADVNIESFVPVAKAILRHSELRKEIDLMQSRKGSTKQ